MTDHPITPPESLLRHWQDVIQHGYSPGRIKDMLTEAFQTGADQELEACCEWVSQWRCMVGGNRPEVGLRDARRPKPPSLKEQALAELELLRGDAYNHGLGFDAPAIRRALESLPD